MTARILWQQVVPAFIIVGELWVAIALRPTNSGIDIQVSSAPPLKHAPISVTKVGRRETLGTKLVRSDEIARFNLDPGRYEVTVPVGSAVARRRVLVPDERYVRVTIVARDATS
jgi:hypothetical protein